MKWDLKTTLTLIIVVPWVICEAVSAYTNVAVPSEYTQVATTAIMFYFGTKVAKKEGEQA